MVWIGPQTAIAGAVLTASDYNTYIRDNLLYTCTALAQDPLAIGPRWFVTDGVGHVAPREMVQVVLDVAEHSKNSQWADLQTPGPISPGVRTGGSMLVSILAFSQMYRPLGAALISFEVHETDPATSVDTRIVVPADDSRAIGFQRAAAGSWLVNQLGGMFLIGDLVPEKPYWVKMKYRIELGTGTTDDTARYDRRSVTVYAL